MHSVQPTSSRVVLSTLNKFPTISTLLSHINVLINTLNESPQDDVKYHALKVHFFLLKIRNDLFEGNK